MKKAFCIISCLVVLAAQCATAQTTIKIPPKVSFSFIKHLEDPHNPDMPDFSLLHQKPKSLKPRHHANLSPAGTDAINFSMLRSRASRSKATAEIFSAKFVHNDAKNRLAKPYTTSAFIFSTFDQPQDGSGINIKLAERTSLNLDLVGCYEGSGQNADADADSCGQSPDLDMSISFVFDLK